MKEENYIYPCFCSDERLKIMREEQLRNNTPPKYDGHCRNLTREEIDEKIRTGVKFCWRLKLPENYEARFYDVVHGDQIFPAGTIGDFVIWRSDNTPTYIFASAVDDYLMKISHIIRGDEHIPNTARQIALLDILNWPRPEFIHIPMVLSSERKKLGKRTGSTPIREYRERGFLPEALRAYLGTLSWSADKNINLLNLNDMCKNFDPSQIVKSSPVHDEDHLMFWQKKAMNNKSPDEIAKNIINFDPRFEKYSVDDLKILVSEIINDVPFINGMAESLKFLVERPECNIKVSWSKEFSDEILNLSEWDVNSIEKFLRGFMKQNNLKGREFFHPLRIILTGQEHGAPLPQIIFVMGKQDVSEIFK